MNRPPDIAEGFAVIGALMAGAFLAGALLTLAVW